MKVKAIQNIVISHFAVYFRLDNLDGILVKSN